MAQGREPAGSENTESLDAFLVGLDDATRPLTDSGEITQTAARLLGERLQVSRCAYSDIEEDENTFNLTGDYIRGVSTMVGRYTIAQFGEECLRLMRDGLPFIAEDTETDPRVAAVLDSYRVVQIRAIACVPLLKAGRLVAAIAVHQTSPREWRPDEIEAVRRVASRCWESIERAHVARVLRESEHRYRFLAESIPQMVWTATADGLLDYVNGQGVAYFGALQKTVLGTGWLAWVHPDDQEQTIACWKESLDTGKPYETMFRLRRGNDGAWRWHLVRALALTDETGKVVQWFGTCTDIEDQKRAEASLHEQWHTFDTALSNTPDFTYTFDLEGRFTYVNRALLSLWQKPLEEARGKNFFELDYPPDLAARLQLQIRQVIETLQPVRDQTDFTGPTGETRTYDYIFVPVLDSEGRASAVAGSTRDITDQRKTEQELRRMNRELEEFAFVASHDLQEPLRMVNIYTQMLLRNPAGEKEKLIQYGEFVQEGVARLESLIHDLLTFSRSVQAEDTPVGNADLSAAFAEACAVLKGRIDEADAIVDAPALPVTRGETSQLVHVFQNVLSNALKYRKKDIPPEIVVAAEQDGDQWIISIRDNGIGFEPQYAERIFGLFKRLHKDEYAGTGLGLAICQRIVERYGGRMWAEGRPAEGATFYFSLPAAQDSPAGGQ